MSSPKEQIRALLEWDRKVDELIEKEAKAVTKTFSQIFAEDKEPMVTYVPELDCNVKFKALTVAETLELEKITNPTKHADEVLFRMWRKGDPTVNRAEFEQLADWKKAAIFSAMIRKIPFLPQNLPPISSEIQSSTKRSNSSLDTDRSTNSEISST